MSRYSAIPEGPRDNDFRQTPKAYKVEEVEGLPFFPSAASRRQVWKLRARSACVVQVRRTEAVGNQLADPVAHHRRSVPARAENPDVAAAELRRFEDRLAAAAARRAHRRPVAARNRDLRDLAEPERHLRRRQRALLGTDAEPVAGVLDIGPGDDFSVRRFDRATDA